MVLVVYVVAALCTGRVCCVRGSFVMMRDSL